MDLICAGFYCSFILICRGSNYQRGRVGLPLISSPSYFCVCPNITQCVVGFCVINCLKWEVIAHLVDIGIPSTATDFRFVFIILHITMFASSWPPVVCRRVHVLFTLFVVSNTYCVAFLFCLSSCCVPYIAKFSGLFICDYWYYYMQLFWSVFNTATQLKNAVRRVWRYQRGNQNP